MHDAISREQLKNELYALWAQKTSKATWDAGYREGMRRALEAVCAAPALKDVIPAADARHVVTCGKCKYGKYTGTEWFCDKHSGHADKFGEDASYHEYHSKHWFCADGEDAKNGD